MELPDDVLQLIREYSMPLTRPDWRTLHKMTVVEYKNEFYNQYMFRFHAVRHNPYMKFKEVFTGFNFLYIFNWYYNNSTN